MLTTINSLPFDQWLATFGHVWRSVIDAGVMCIMSGHISLPDYQRYRADPEHDFDRRLQGVRDGRLSEEQVQDATRRVLAMKARLNLFASSADPAPTAEQRASFAAAAQTMADKSVTILRQNESMTLTLEPGTSVLTVTYGQFSPMFGESDLEEFDQALTARGFVVSHLLNPGRDELRQAAEACQVVFINLSLIPFTTLTNIRMTDTFGTWGWRCLYRTHPQVVYTASRQASASNFRLCTRRSTP